MNMLFLLSRLCSFLFYFALASFLLPSPFEEPIGNYELLLICLASAFFCFCLRERKLLRFLPLSILALLFFSLHNLMDLLLMAPLAVYVLRTSIKNDFEITYIEFQHISGLRGRILAILLLVCILLYALVDLRSVFILCLAYFTCGIMLLRALRHHEDTYSKASFILLNCIPGLVFALGVFLLSLSSEPIISVISTLWFGLRMALYFLIVVPFTFVVGLLGSLFDWIYLPKIEREVRPVEQSPRAPLDFSEIAPQAFDPNLARLLLLVLSLAGALIFIVLIIYLVKKILFTWKFPSLGSADKDDILESSALKKAEAWFPKLRRSPAIRRYYRKYLKLCAAQKIEIKKADTTFEIGGNVQKRFGTASDFDQLRALYLLARYREEGLTKKDELLAKKAYKGIREMMK